MEAAVNRARSEIKLYLANISFTAADHGKQRHDLAAIAVNLEYVGSSIRALKTINSLVATIGDHVVAETGDVLDSRLKPAS